MWVFASFGSVDNSFNIGAPTGFNNTVSNILRQNDGKLIVYWDFTTYKWVSANRIIRLNSDGSRDTTFDIWDWFGQAIWAITIQSDGKILVGGWTNKYQWLDANYLIRLNSDGSRDDSFNTSAWDRIGNTISKLIIQPDNKIIIVAWSNIVRVNADGSEDISFSGPWLNGSIFSVSRQNDGKLIVGGDFNNYHYLMRLNTDGSIDNSFSIGAGFSSDPGYLAIYVTAIQGDGKILVGGRFNNYQWISANEIIRLNSDGSRDTTFDIGSGINNGTPESFVIQSNGKILITWVYDYQWVSANWILRLNEDWSRDDSFTPPNKYFIWNPILEPNGNLIMLGLGGLAHLYSNGEIDNSFVSSDWFDRMVETVALQSDGKVLVGGLFTTYKWVSANSIIRLNTDGSRDDSFDIGTLSLGQVFSIVLQADGKILVGWDGYPYLVRLNQDWSIDDSFSSGDIDGYVYTIVVQPDGKILVGWDFSTYIARLNDDGSLDDSFSIGDSFDNDVYTIALQADGKILVGWDFSTYDGDDAFYTARLNDDWSIDYSFSVDWSISGIHSIALQGDGKILVAWYYEPLILRLNDDGSIDDSFTFDNSLNSFGNINIVYIQDDQKILVGWGSNVNGLAFVNSDGSIDTSFNNWSGFNSSVYSLALQADGKIFVGWDFSTYNWIPAWYLTSLYGNVPVVELPNSTNTTTVNDAFKERWYTETNWTLLGSSPISLSITNGDIPVNLIVQNTNITLTLDAYTQIKKRDTTNYNGLISVPISKTITSVNDHAVISAFNVGSRSESINLLWGVATLSIPVSGQNMGQDIQVYYSQDNGVTWYPEVITQVISKSWTPTVEFTTNHFADFALTQSPDITPPTATISYSISSWTNQDVIATLTGISETITGLNAASHTFTGNGSFIFTFQDLAWNTGSTIATVNWIDKTIPTASVIYNITWATDQNVIATLTGFSKTIAWWNVPNYMFTENGTFMFTFRDLVWNFGNITATVNRINKTISNTWESNNTPTNNGGSNIGWGGGGFRSDIINTVVDGVKETLHWAADEKPTPSLKGSRYPAETNNAYLWAYGFDITTQPSIQQANIDGTLTRKDMAKMITNFAVNVLKKTIASWTNCVFSDIATQSKETQTYATAACRLGLMGYNSDGKTLKATFDPNTEVDRAQFGTILSRVLYGDKHNASNITTPYYANHLDALKDVWVMSKINSPTQKELRGYVLLMMMRSVK